MIKFPPDHPAAHAETWDVVDSTKVKEFMQCPRRYFYRYILGWTSSEPSIHLKFGEAWHIAMEILLQGEDGYPDYSPDNLNRAFEGFLDKYREHFSELDDLGNYPKNPECAFDALVKYSKVDKNKMLAGVVPGKEKDAFAGNCEDMFKVLHTEVAGSIPLRLDKESPELHFKIDAIIQDVAGQFGPKDLIWIQEHKTSLSGISSRTWKQQWLLDVQPHTYTHAVYSYYHPDQVGGVLINGTHFMRRKSDNIEFIRLPLRKSPDTMQTWVHDMEYWLGLIDEEMQKLAKEKASDPVMVSFPKNTTSCTDYFGCPYLDFCTMWPNPLRRTDQPPIGMQVNHWDPREKKKSAKAVIQEGKIIERK